MTPRVFCLAIQAGVDTAAELASGHWSLNLLDHGWPNSQQAADLAHTVQENFPANPLT